MGCWQRMQNVVMDSVPKSSVSRTSFLPANGYVGSTTHALRSHRVIGTSPDRDLIGALAQPSHRLLSRVRRGCVAYHIRKEPIGAHLLKHRLCAVLTHL